MAFVPFLRINYEWNPIFQYYRWGRAVGLSLAMALVHQGIKSDRNYRDPAAADAASRLARNNLMR